jgi:hypothetical protein
MRWHRSARIGGVEGEKTYRYEQFGGAQGRRWERKRYATKAEDSEGR